MGRKRIRTDKEPIAELFGDVVQDRPSFLYSGDDPPDPAPDAAEPEAPEYEERRRLVHVRRARAVNAAAASALSALPREVHPRCVDDRGLWSAVVILHGAISSLTLGLYGPWLKTEIRRVRWSHTEIDGERLEYTGLGSELFRGALIALAALAVLAVAAALVFGFLGLRFPGDDGATLAAFAPALGLLLLAPLAPWAAFRGRRYRLSRTRWKGVRFGMEGSGRGMVGLWFRWAPVVLVTLGLAFPHWRWARERRLTRSMRWGDAAFGFAGRPWPLLAHWAPLWAALAVPALVLASPTLRAALDPVPRLEAGKILAPLAAALLYALLTALAFLNYSAAETRLFMNARRLAGAEIRCDFSVWHLVDALLAVARRNIWPGLLVYLLIGAIAAIPLYGAIRTELENPGSLSVFGGLEGDLFHGFQSWRAQGLLLMAFVINSFLSAVFGMWLWLHVHARRRHQHLCNSLTIAGAQSLEAVRQRQRDRGVLAEGAEDALDLIL